MGKEISKDDLAKMNADFTAKTDAKLKELVDEATTSLKDEIKEGRDEITALKAKMNSTDTLSDEKVRERLMVDAFILVQTNVAKDIDTAIDMAIENTDALNETVPGEGKELVKKEWNQNILVRKEEIRKTKTNTYNISSNEYAIRKYANGSNTQGVAPGAAPTFSQGETSIVDYVPYDVKTAVKVIENLSDDVAETLGLIFDDIAESQEIYREKQIFIGDGSAYSRTGIMNNVGISEVPTPKTKFADLTTSEMSDLLDDMEIALANDMRGTSEFTASTYEYGVLRKLKDSNGFKAFPELKGKNKELNGYPFNIIDYKIILDDGTDVASARGLLFGSTEKAYDEINRKDVDIKSGYIDNDMIKGVKTIYAHARHNGGVGEEDGFVVSVNSAI